PPRPGFGGQLLEPPRAPPVPGGRDVDRARPASPLPALRGLRPDAAVSPELEVGSRSDEYHAGAGQPLRVVRRALGAGRLARLPPSARRRARVAERPDLRRSPFPAARGGSRGGSGARGRLLGGRSWSVHGLASRASACRQLLWDQSLPLPRVRRTG